MLSDRISHVLSAVGLGCAILCAAPLTEGVLLGVSRARPDSPRQAHARLEAGDLVARMTLPRLGIDSPVFEGVGLSELSRGAGHVPTTALPGEKGGGKHSVIAVAGGPCGNAIERLRLGDRVDLKTPFGARRYRVIERRVLAPGEIRLARAGNARVSLVTPYPSDSRGPAPGRLAVAMEPMD